MLFVMRYNKKNTDDKYIYSVILPLGTSHSIIGVTGVSGSTADDELWNLLTHVHTPTRTHTLKTLEVLKEHEANDGCWWYLYLQRQWKHSLPFPFLPVGSWARQKFAARSISRGSLPPSGAHATNWEFLFKPHAM